MIKGREQLKMLAKVLGAKGSNKSVTERPVGSEEQEWTKMV